MKIWAKLVALFNRKKLETDMAEEMRLHLERRVEENVSSGMSPNEARYAALRKFGGVEQLKEQCRDQRFGVWVEIFWRDLRHAKRSLARAPGFSLTVLVTLGLCFGPATAVFSALYALVLRPLPFPDPEQIVQIHTIEEKRDGMRRIPSLAQFLHFKERADLFDHLAVMAGVNGTIGEESAPTRISVTSVSTEFFQVLGIKPVAGRFFTADEMSAGKDHVFVITRTYWENQYGGDPNIIGRKVWMDGEPYTIIGVAPGGFEDFQTTMEVFKPFLWEPRDLWRRGGVLVGRMKSGISLAAAAAQLETLNRALIEREAPVEIKTYSDRMGCRMGLSRMGSARAEPFVFSLTLLQFSAAFVVLIGCVNVANLFLARANARRTELAVRHALGAGWATLLRHMIMESLLLTGMATLSGIALAAGAVQLINRYVPLVVRWAPAVEIQPVVWGAVCAGAVMIGIVVGVIPFLVIWCGGLGLQHARTTSASGAVRSVSRWLVVAQVAIASVLLIGAGLMIRSFANVLAVAPGFDAKRVVQGGVSLPRIRYQEKHANTAVRQRLLAALREIPGIESVAISSNGVERSFPMTSVTPRKSGVADATTPPVAAFNVVSPEYFSTMGIRLVEGRNFTEQDTRGGESAAVIVDETFSKRFFDGRSPVGHEVSFSPPGAPQVVWSRIIGVVSRAHLTGLEERDSVPFAYVPGVEGALGYNFLLRTVRPAGDVIAEMRRKFREVDPALPLKAPGVLQESLHNLMVTRRGIMYLLGVFAGLAMLLAGVGLYGVLSYDVSQRTREIGIRGALGATRRQIVAMILREGIVRIALGLSVGIAFSAYLMRFLRSLLFDVAPTDAVAHVLVLVALGAVGVVASWLPARRAAKVDPVLALRVE